MMAIAENRGGFLTSDFYGALRHRGAQDIVQPGVAFHFFLNAVVYGKMMVSS